MRTSSHPSESFPFGAVPIGEHGRAITRKTVWFCAKTDAMNYGRQHYGHRFSLALAFPEPEDGLPGSRFNRTAVPVALEPLRRKYLRDNARREHHQQLLCYDQMRGYLDEIAGSPYRRQRILY